LYPSRLMLTRFGDAPNMRPFRALVLGHEPHARGGVMQIWTSRWRRSWEKRSPLLEGFRSTALMAWANVDSGAALRDGEPRCQGGGDGPLRDGRHHVTRLW